MFETKLFSSHLQNLQLLLVSSKLVRLDDVNMRRGKKPSTKLDLDL